MQCAHVFWLIIILSYILLFCLDYLVAAQLAASQEGLSSMSE
jgi:hypothetical protein